MSDPPLDAVVNIRAETSIVDPDTCKFTVDRVVHPGGPFAFNHNDPATNSPLADRLFALGHITHVLIADTTVTVTKSSSGSWDLLRRSIGAQIRTQLFTANPAIIDSCRTSGRSDSQIRAAIEDLLDREVNPSIAAHGGKISVVDVTERALFIAMSGGCQGCASSTATLRDGFETMARLVVPELIDIIDTTNHAAGTTPFYPTDEPPTLRPSPLNHAPAGH